MVLKKLKLIYNPYSGDKSFRFDLDVCIRMFQEAGYEVHLFRTSKKGDIAKHIESMDDCYEALVVAGGDGTLNIVINGLLKRGIDIPIGIIPSGTANDFARHLGISELSIEDCCQIVKDGHIERVDVGQINNSYFINVCAGGLMSTVSQRVDEDLKNTLGKMAYYIDGIKQVPNFEAIPLVITNSSGVIKEDVYLFLVLNSCGAGSFDKLAYKAKINDGLMDFVAIKAKPIIEMAVLFIKMLQGQHLDDPNIIFFQDSYVKIETSTTIDLLRYTDNDGEEGPKLPVEIKTLKGGIQIFSHKHE